MLYFQPSYFHWLGYSNCWASLLYLSQSGEGERPEERSESQSEKGKGETSQSAAAAPNVTLTHRCETRRTELYCAMYVCARMYVCVCARMYVCMCVWWFRGPTDATTNATKVCCMPFLQEIASIYVTTDYTLKGHYAFSPAGGAIKAHWVQVHSNTGLASVMQYNWIEIKLNFESLSWRCLWLAS